MKKLSPFHSIFGQGLFVLLICIGASTLTLGFLSHHSASDLGRRGLTLRAQEVTAMMAELGGGSIRFGKEKLLHSLLTKAAAQSKGEQDAGLAMAADGVILANVGLEQADAATMKSLARRAIESGTAQTSPQGDIVAFPSTYGPQKQLVGAIATHWNLRGIEAFLAAKAQHDNTYTGFVFLIAMIAGLMSLFVWMSRPLERLSAAIRQVEGRDYDAAIPGLRRRDEVGEIGHALDDLRIRLAEADRTNLEAIYKGAAFEGSSAAMMLIDKDLKVRHINPAMRKLMADFTPAIRVTVPDFDPERVVGQSISRLHADPRPMQKLIDASKSGMANVQMRLGDRRLKLTTAIFHDAAGETLGSVMEWKDITDEALNAATLEAINADQCRAEFETNGKLVLCNARFAEALGAGEGALAGRSLDDLLDPNWASAAGQRDLLARLAAGEAAPNRIQLRGQGGATAIFDCGIAVVRDQEGAPMRYLFLGRDITEEERRFAAAEATRLAMAEGQTRVVDVLRKGLRHLREGDFTRAIGDAFAAEYDELRTDYNATLQTLAGALGEIADNASNIFSEARDISSTADSLSRRTESTAATLEETAAALDQLTTSVRSAADRATEADIEVEETRRKAERGGEVVIETVEAMDRISTSSDRIASITNVIEDIAFQTNLLALNAGVEAARAGDAGRGFAVVASEVRALAQRCSEAAREINELIAESGTHVKHGVDLVGQTGDALREIVQSIAGINGLVSEIAGSARQQSSGLAEINAAVNDLDQSTQQNAARLEEATAASQSLTNDAMAMVEAVSHFQIGKEHAVPDSVVPFASRREPSRPEADPSGEGTRNVAAAAATSARKVVGAGDELVEADPDGWSEY